MSLSVYLYHVCSVIFKIKVERVGLRLTEDRVPANITSPGSIPTEVWLPKLLVKRNPEGVFTILPLKEGESSSGTCLFMKKKFTTHDFFCSLLLMIIVVMLSLTLTRILPNIYM